MGARNNKPQNHIILEGLWGLGKSKLANAYCSRYQYTLLKEPLHTSVEDSGLIKSLESWYLKTHQLEMNRLIKNESPLVMERSILSTFAFSYALNKSLPDIRFLSSYRKLIEKNKILVVYLHTNPDDPGRNPAGLTRYSANIRRILLHRASRYRYQEWYEKVLPQKYGILPFILHVESLSGERRTTGDLTKEIHSCLSCERIAQVNVICFTKAIGSKKEMRILMLKRSARKGGFWQNVTGGVHPGESPLKAAVREVGEETGLSRNKIRPFWVPSGGYSFVGNDGYRLYEYVFGCEISNPTKIQISDEHEDLNWLLPKEAKSLIPFQEPRQAIDKMRKRRPMTTGRPQKESDRFSNPVIWRCSD